MKCSMKVVMMMKACSMHLQHISYLMNMHFQRLWKPYAIIIILLMISNIVGVLQYGDPMIGFEAKFYRSFLCLPMVLLALFAWCCYYLFDCVQVEKKSHLSERLHVLPISRMDIIWSQILSIVVSLLIFCVFESIIFLACFYMDAMVLQTYSIQNEFYFVIMNAVYCSFFIPLTFFDGLKIVTCIFFLSTLIVFLSRCFPHLLKCIVTICIILAGISFMVFIWSVLYLEVGSQYLENDTLFTKFILYYSQYKLYNGITLICSIAMIQSLFRMMKRKYI